GTVTGSGDTWPVTVTTGPGQGSFRVDLVDDDSITDLAGTAVGGPGPQNFTGQTYVVDRQAPSVVSITRLDADPTNAASVNYQVQFSEAVSGVDAADFALTATGSLAGTSITNVAGGG